MYGMSSEQLQAVLPPFEGVEDVLTEHQDIYNIITEVIEAHSIYQLDYDRIAPLFSGPGLYESLFNWCQQNLDYVAESEKWQTSRAPAAILAMSPITGVDCKHYAGWIAGLIAAEERRTGKRIDWVYRFASYDPFDDEPGHVFVVVNEDGKEIWIDPTPIIDPNTHIRTKRFFNDRLMKPESFIDKKVKKMSLSRIHGMNPNPPAERNIGANYSVSDDGCLGEMDVYYADITDGGGGGGGGVTLDYAAPAAGVTGAEDGTDATAALNAVQPGLGTAVQQAISVLPEGDLKDFVNAFLKDPGQALKTLIFGRTYTIGDYKLAEVFMRSILGMSQIQRWQQVPDGYVPPAWAFFCAASGVRIRTYDDLEALCAYHNTPQERAQYYFSRNPANATDMSMEAAVRFAYLMGGPDVGGLFNIYEHRDVKWPLVAFNPDPNNHPYIYPIPGVVPNANFTGSHPILGVAFVDGYPADWAGIKYTNQLHQGIARPALNPPAPVPSTGSGTTVTPGTPAATTKAGFGNVLGWGLLAAAAGFALYGFMQPDDKKAGVYGIRKGNKTGLIIAGSILAALGGWYFYSHYSIAGKKKQLLDWNDSLTSDSDAGKLAFKNALNIMTDDEIAAVYEFIFKYLMKGIQLTDQVDYQLRARILAISTKYNLFT